MQVTRITETGLGEDYRNVRIRTGQIITSENESDVGRPAVFSEQSPTFMFIGTDLDDLIGRARSAIDFWSGNRTGVPDLP